MQHEWKKRTAVSPWKQEWRSTGRSSHSARSGKYFCYSIETLFCFSERNVRETSKLPRFPLGSCFTHERICDTIEENGTQEKRWRKIKNIFGMVPLLRYLLRLSRLFS